MTPYTLVVYGHDGVMRFIVHFEEGEKPNLDDPSWNLIGGVTIPISRADYDVIGDSGVSLSGRVIYADLSRALLDKISNVDPLMAVKVQAEIDLADAEPARLAVEGVKRKAAYDSFFASLTKEQKDEFDVVAAASDKLAVVKPAVAILAELTPEQAEKYRALYDTGIAVRIKAAIQ